MALHLIQSAERTANIWAAGGCFVPGVVQQEIVGVTVKVMCVVSKAIQIQVVVSRHCYIQPLKNIFTVILTFSRCVGSTTQLNLYCLFILQVCSSYFFDVS